MRLESALISIMALLLGFLLLLTGVFCLLPFFQAKMITYLETHISQIGIMAIVFALLLLICFVPLCRRRYLLIEMGDTKIQDSILSEIAQKSIASHFPGKEVRCDALIRQKRKVEIFANLPYVKVEDQQQVLTDIEEKLARSLAHQCGLTRKFHLNVSFRTKIPTT